MNFLKRPYVLRRYLEPTVVRGYISIPYKDMTLPMDIQTLEDTVMTTADGSRSVQRLKVFCDSQILVDGNDGKQKADRIWFQNTWFECKSSRLSDNTPLRHWTATFVECLKQEAGPKNEEEESEAGEDESESS